jgi:multicomponent Na+:H+ antiporter subunit E
LGIAAFGGFLMYKLVIFGLLLVTWIVLSGQFDSFHLSLGGISCALITWLSGDMLFVNRSMGLRGRLRQFRLLVGYSLFLLLEIIKANLHVLMLAISPRMDAVKPQIFRFQTDLKSDFTKWVLANSITLTPGTVTLQVRDSSIYVHAISEKVLMESGGEMERRIKEIFEPEVIA